MAAGSASLDHDMYHVPQQSRREKLRFAQEDGIFVANPHNFGFCAANPSQKIPFSLSLSSSFNQVGTRQQLGPFTGYAEILSRSRFLGPARELLEEIFSASGVVVNNRFTEDPMADDVTRGGMDGRMDGRMVVVQQRESLKKSRLISMIDEVHQRYKMYYQQVQAVITSFESVPGLSSAAPYASMALKAMSKHFLCLKKAMSDQLDQINKGRVSKEGEESSGFGLTSRAVNVNYGTTRQPHIWRPRRGLPEWAVAVLRVWLFEHFLHPYPTDTDKQILAKQTGLTRNQVSNWFINARVRLWKPMVEEIHSLETHQQNKSGSTSDTLTATDKQYSQHPH